MIYRPSVRTAALILGAVLAMIAWSAFPVRPAAAAAEPGLELALADLSGKQVRVKDLLARGPVLVDFWATWCKPCVKALPHYEALQKEFGPQGLTVVAISEDSGRSLAKVRPFVESNRYTFTVLLDPNGEAKRRFKAGYTPTTILIDRSGARVYTHIGYKPGDEKELREKVAALFASSGTCPGGGPGPGAGGSK